MKLNLASGFAALLVTAALVHPAPAADLAVGPLKLLLPPAVYAVPGVPISLYFDNLVLTETPEAYRFEIVADGLGTAEARRWTLTPTAEQVGDHPLTVTVRDAAGAIVGEASTVLHIAPADAGAGRPLTLLIIGDSLTGNSLYPNEIGRLLNQPGNPAWAMLGSVKSAAVPGVAHEGYGGWTWQRFATHHEPAPNPAERKFSSPFVFLDAAGAPKLDIARYLAEKAEGKQPDVITILLGINDNFGAKPDDPAAIDASIDRMFGHADTLLAALRAAAPNAEIGIGLTTPPNSRESGFEANYQGRYHRWGWKRIQHRLVERLIERFDGRQDEKLFIIPTELNLDPVDGYPDNNGVHPNAVGYQQIGQSIYAWLKSRLEAR